MAHDRCNYFSFCAIFCPLTPLTAQKMKISKKWKKYLEISSFYTSVPKVIIICYTVPEIWRVTDVTVFVCFFILGNFLPFYPSKSPKNENLFKNEKNKNAREVSSFNTSVSKIMIIYFTVPEIWHVTDVIPILHNCTKNHENMLYCYWDMSCVTDVTVIFHFGVFFVSNDRKGLFIN